MIFYAVFGEWVLCVFALEKGTELTQHIPDQTFLCICRIVRGQFASFRHGARAGPGEGSIPCRVKPFQGHNGKGLDRDSDPHITPADGEIAQ